MRWWQRRGLRFKVALSISLALILILGSALVGLSTYIRQQLWQREAEAAQSLNSVAAALLDDAMMAGHRDQVHAALLKLGQSVGGQIDDLAVYDDQSVLTSFASGFPGGRTISQASMEQDLQAPGCWVCHRLPPEERPAMAVVTLQGQEVLRNVVPLYNLPRCQTCHGTGQKVLGDSIVDLRLDRYQRSVNTVTVGLAGGLGVAVLLVSLVLYLVLRRIILSPLGDLVEVAQGVAGGELDRQVAVRNQDEIGRAGVALNYMTAQLRGLIDSLERRVAARTRDLERRTTYLQASAEVSRAATSILVADTLIRQVVESIKVRFGLYYVGLFLVDERSEWAVLEAGSGEAGRKMLAQGHRLKVGEGMIGWSINHGEARVASDTGLDAVHFSNPDLPDTRSEAAIPLRSRGRVLGALSVQSTEPAAFDEEMLVALQTMADQVAVALDNARLFAESQEAMDAQRRAYGEVSREAWAELVHDRPDLGFLCDRAGIVRPTTTAWRPEMLEAGETGGTIRDGGKTLAIPIKIRDQVAGVMRLRKPDGSGEWQPDEVELMEALTGQLGAALEGARLYQDTQRRAAREQLVGEVTSRMRETLDLEMVLQTALREMGGRLGIPRIEVRLGRQLPNGGDGRGGDKEGNGHAGLD